MTRKLSKAESGKLGYLAAKATIKQKHLDRIRLYNKDPKECKHCGKPLKYEKRKNTFCSKSCSASDLNKDKKRKLKHKGLCVVCDSPLPKSCQKYCSNSCFQEDQYRKRIYEWVELGIVPKSNSTPSYARRYLGEKFGVCCSVCGITDWCGKPITFDIDHIDGNPLNHSHDNLRLLCKNCHSQTDSYGSKNNGNGRKWRYKK